MFDAHTLHHNLIASVFLKSIMVGKDHICEVRETSDNFPCTLTHYTLPCLGHIEWGLLNVPLGELRRSPKPPFLVHPDGGYLVSSTLRKAVPKSFPFQAFWLGTAQHPPP